MPLILRFLLVVSMVVVVASPVHAGTADSPRFWSGEIQLRGGSWPIRIRLEGSADGPEALIDLPDLEFYGESAPVQAKEGSNVSIELPFGLGAFEFPTDEEEILIERSLSSGAVLGLALKRDDRPPYASLPVHYDSAGATLAGTILLPDGEGPYPAVVFIHGAATGQRGSWPYRKMSDRLARNGIAVLLYDRRGEGESHIVAEDAPLDRNFDVLAADAIAGVRQLQSTDRIDPKRIGLLGGSQGGWIAARAAMDCPDVAFLVLRVTPGRMPSQTTIDECLARMRADDRSDDEIQAALAHWRLYFSYVQTGEGWDLLLASSKRAEENEWGAYVDQPQVPEHLDWWRLHHAFDMRRTLRALEVPVLALYGTRDPIASAELDAPLLRKALEAAGVEHRVEIIDQADHGMELPGMYQEEGTGTWIWPRYAPQARDAIIEWILAHERQDASLDATTPDG